MTDEQISRIIEEELKLKTLGVTEQYLEVHNVVYKNNKAIIERIDRERGDNTIIVYLPVAGETFYFAAYIDPETKTVSGFHTEANYRVYFKATSETMTLPELSSLTKLKPTESWNKGDIRTNTNSKLKFSLISFFPNPEPDEFEDKLNKLMDFLEQDIQGIKALISQASGCIQAAITYHDANGMLGGPTIDARSIKRMNDLGLEINFDLYVEGNPLK